MGTRSRPILAALAAGLLMGSVAWFFADDTSRGPHLEIAQEHDLGEVRHAERRRISVEFRNSGNEVLRIDRVVAGCSCMVVDLAKREYQPGERGRLEFDFLSARLPGAKIEQTAVVYSNDSRIPVHHLVFHGRMVPALSTSPAVLHVRNVPVGGEWTRDLVVAGVGADMEFEITAVSSNIEGLVSTTSRSEGPGKLETGQSVPRKYKIVVHQPSVEEVGEFSGQIWIDTTNQRFQRLTVPVTVEVPSAFHISPKLLFFPRAVESQSARPIAQILTISASQPVELTLRSADVPITCDSDTTGRAREWVFTCHSRPGLKGTVTGVLEFDVVGYPPESTIEVSFAIVID